MQGYWDRFGERSIVDWCEVNYAHAPWIAEFWNTLSSLVIFFVGAYGALRWWRHREHLELRFGVAFASLAVIGLGSAAFHATLLRIPQACDELPMVWLGVICFYCLVTRREDTADRVRMRWLTGLALGCLVFTSAYFVVADYFALFIGVYGAVVGYVCVVTWRVAFRESRDARVRGLFWWSVVAYIGGFVLFWIPERTLGCDHPFQSLQPHTLFHLSSSVGPYAWILLATMDRLLRLGHEPRLDRKPIPFVTRA
jgi:dihydroceramidase